jgi:superfamily II DNA or RNA helicase
MKIQIAANAVAAKIINASDELKLKLVELMSYAVAGSEHMSRNDWSGRSTLFSYEKSTFPAGLLSLAVSALQRDGYQIQLIRKPAPAPNGPPEPIVNGFARNPDYQYQYDAVDQLVRHRQIIAQVATGGGKTNIANIALARLRLPTLFITTRSVLMHQMKAAFETSLAYRAQHGEPHLGAIRVGVMGDGEFSPTKTVCVAMVQTIQARLTDKNPAVRQRMREILQTYQLVIAEEAHEASGNGYYEVLSLCTEAHYRLALTGTPFMKEDEEANMKLMACSGPVAIRVTEKELIDKGILSTPIFKYVAPPQAPQVARASNYQRAYHYGIVHNEGRNKLIALEAKRATAMGLSTMILVQRKEHGKILKDLIDNPGVRVRYIFGESDREERDECLKKLGKTELDVLIGSTILDVGVDVPSVNLMILAGGGKAEVALRQRIGRVLRRKRTGLNVSYIVDFNDSKNKHLIAHSAQRRAIVEGTPGFAEGILPAGKDFDFSHLTKK